MLHPLLLLLSCCMFCAATAHRVCRCTTSLLFVSRQWVLTWNNCAPFEHDMSVFTLVCACANPASANHTTLLNFVNCSNGCSHATASHLTRAQTPESTVLCTTTPCVSMSFHAASPGDSMTHYISLLSRSFFFLSRSFETISFFPPEKYALLAPVALLPAVFPIANVELHFDLLLLVRLLLWFLLRLFLLFLLQLVLLPLKFLVPCMPCPRAVDGVLRVLGAAHGVPFLGQIMTWRCGVVCVEREGLGHWSPCKAPL